MEDAFGEGARNFVQYITKFPVECVLLYLGISVGCFSIKASNEGVKDNALGEVLYRFLLLENGLFFKSPILLPRLKREIDCKLSYVCI